VPSMVDKVITAARSQTVQLPGQDTTTTTTAVLIANLARQMLDGALPGRVPHPGTAC
jgi:hypothetical protein